MLVRLLGTSSLFSFFPLRGGNGGKTAKQKSRKVEDHDILKGFKKYLFARMLPGQTQKVENFLILNGNQVPSG